MLLGIVLYQTMGYVVTYHVSKEYFEESAREATSRGAVERLAVQSSALGKELIQTDGSEIMYQGRLFDFSRKEIKGDSIIFYGRYDNDEEHWLAQDANQPVSIQAISFQKNFQLDFLRLYCARPVKHLQLQACYISASQNLTSKTSIHISSVISDIPVPPPQA
jgi:hypothetical protein